MVNYCKYDGAFTFIYSPRVGTPAAKLYEKDKDILTEKIKEERLYRLNDLINEYSNKSNKKMEGKTYKVLVEGISTKEEMVYGYTETNKLVNFKGNEDLIGKRVTTEGSSYVWIPRYTTTSLSENDADIIFSNVTNDVTSANGETYILPSAFTYTEGSDSVELPGIWVSKYEASFDR